MGDSRYNNYKKENAEIINKEILMSKVKNKKISYNIRLQNDGL
jgi:hypothetical protein